MILLSRSPTHSLILRKGLKSQTSSSSPNFSSLSIINRQPQLQLQSIRTTTVNLRVHPRSGGSGSSRSSSSSSSSTSSSSSSSSSQIILTPRSDNSNNSKSLTTTQKRFILSSVSKNLNQPQKSTPPSPSLILICPNLSSSLLLLIVLITLSNLNSHVLCNIRNLTNTNDHHRRALTTTLGYHPSELILEDNSHQEVSEPSSSPTSDVKDTCRPLDNFRKSDQDFIPVRSSRETGRKTCSIVENEIRDDHPAPPAPSSESSKNKLLKVGRMTNDNKKVPPQPPPIWTHSAQEILDLTNQAIEQSRKNLAKIASLRAEDCNFESVIVPLEEDEVLLTNAGYLTFYQYVSTKEDVRNSAVEADKLIQEYDLEVSSRLDIYNSLLSAKKNIDQSKLDPESIRLIEKLILQRTRNGLDLSEEDRKKFNKIKSEINNLAIDFQKNLNEETGKIWFTAEELEGVPEDVISGYEKNEDGKFAMSFKTPDFVPVIQYAINPETRKRALLGYDSRSSVNVPILEKILKLRKEASKVLKKVDWATHSLEVKMAKSPKTVIEFLGDLRKKLEPIGIEEKKNLIELKKKEYKELGLKGDPEKFYIWDYRYYDRLYTEKTLDLKSEIVKQYFPVKKVVNVILEIYQRLLSVKFVKIENNESDLWFKDVIQFEVWNNEDYVDEDDKDGNGFLGYLHLDLEPRDNKYGHAAVWGLIPGYLKKDGTRNYPVAAMVANLAKETASKPALLTHDSVVTFFHEMGHAFHQLCSKTKYARFHGTNVSRDFVEAPSQMLENWCWKKEQLIEISSHYKNEDEKLPAELIEKIILSRDLNSGLSNLRQIFFGMFDMYVHTKWDSEDKSEENDLTKVWCKMRDEINLFDPSLEKSPGQSAFGHIVGGYDAGYYGYLYSQVFSADMFLTKFEEDPMSVKVGRLYREEILRPGGSREEIDSLEKFLGRRPSNEAFLKRLLGNVKS